jgi:Bacterial PH domain
MKLCLFLFASSLVFAADWDAIQRIPAAQRIEVTGRSGGGRLRATLVSASPDTVVVREVSGERSIPRADIRELRVFDSGRRVHRGFLWTLVGAGAGAGASLAACISCPGEGRDMAKYVPLGVGAGAAIGALGFLSSPYRTVYKSR